MSKPAKYFEIGKTYSFDTYAPEVLTTRINNVKIIAVMSAQEALQTGYPILEQHERVRPHLGPNAIKDPLTMTYVKFRAYSGKETVYSTSWINMDTLVETDAKQIVITVNQVGFEDQETLRRMLIASGYPDFSMNILE